MLCKHDSCHDFEPATHAQLYCVPCQCYQKVQAERKRKRFDPVACARDGCHTFVPVRIGHIYCTKCACSEREARGRRVTARHAAAEELFEVPQTYQVLRIPALPDGYKVMLVNDLQRPFQDDSTLEAVEKFWDDFAPDLEFLNGDIFDFYSCSQFDQNPSRRFSLKDECIDSREWLHKRRTANPNARTIFGDGNHEDRLRRWLWRYGRELARLTELEVGTLLKLDDMGIEHVNYRSVIDVLGVRVEHGYRAAKSAAFPVNVARLMAIATGSSGLCGHTHRLAVYHWADADGSHSYRENGCLCHLQLEYAPFPNWQQGFTYGTVHNNKLHLTTVPIYPDGFHAEGEFYPRL